MFRSNTETTWVMWIVYGLVMLLMARAVQKAFFYPLRTAKDYITRANQWMHYFRAHSRSIFVLNKGLALPNLSTEEENLLHLELGLAWYRKKNFAEAAKEFQKMLGYFNQTKLPFNPNYSAVVISLYNAGEVQTARSLYHKLRKHETRDIKFTSLRSLDTRIFK